MYTDRIRYTCLASRVPFHTAKPHDFDINITEGNKAKTETLVGHLWIQLICVDDMQLMLLHSWMNAKCAETGTENEPTFVKSIVFCAVMATDCTPSSYKSCRMFFIYIHCDDSD